jgi:hypothetical protein
MFPYAAFTGVGGFTEEALRNSSLTRHPGDAQFDPCRVFGSCVEEGRGSFRVVIVNSRSSALA